MRLISKSFIYRSLYLPFFSRISQHRFTHGGRDCYIFGDGISIKWFDLSSFRDIPVIVNGLLPFHKDFKKLNVMYCVLAEPYWFYPNFFSKYITRTHSQPIISSAYKKFVRDNNDINFFLNFSNFIPMHGQNVDYLFYELPCNSEFNESMNGLNYLYGSFRTSISLAIYLGFENIYLVGCDYTHQPSRHLHWYERGKGLYRDISNYENDFLGIASQFANIYSITIDSSSCRWIHPISYTSHTNCPLDFKENTQLLTKKYQDILRSWGNYSI